MRGCLDIAFIILRVSHVISIGYEVLNDVSRIAFNLKTSLSEIIANIRHLRTQQAQRQGVQSDDEVQKIVVMKGACNAQQRAF